jgi:hypothetical protein
LLIAKGSVLAALSDKTQRINIFENEVRPLLAAECYECHGEEKAKGGLRLDHIDLILKGGDNGPAIVPGKSGESLLIEAIHRSDPDFEMPPKKALTGAQVALLETWIASGATWPEESFTAVERDENGFLNQLNWEHHASRESNTDLEARIRSYELAFAMQAEAPEAIDLDSETEHIKSLYGLDHDDTAVYGRQCLMARRLVERGVRFIQLFHGAGSKWDSHSKMEANHSRLCRNVDVPIVGLIRDLKQRGLLDETLVIWGGEFGRTPMSEKGDGRDHNPTGFTMWMAGGGARGGQTIGATDELGLYATEDKLHVHDIHSTIMAMLGLDHTEVVYMHKGRPERVDLNEGHVHEPIFRS